MSVVRAMTIAVVVSALGAAQQTISFPTEDGGPVCADLYGQGTRAVVLAHGGRFSKGAGGSDVSDVESGNLAETLERIAARPTFRASEMPGQPGVI